MMNKFEKMMLKAGQNEAQVLDLLVSGVRPHMIPAETGIPLRAVKATIKRLHQKLGLPTDPRKHRYMQIAISQALVRMSNLKGESESEKKTVVPLPSVPMSYPAIGVSQHAG